MEDNNDFKTFQTEVKWFVKPGSDVQLQKGDIRLSVEFEDTFPKLTSLIKKARVTFVDIDNVRYLLFAWDTKENLICGWLNEIEDPEAYFAEIISEHELLIGIIGGIREAFNQPENSFTNNQNFMFLGTGSSTGIGDYDDYYQTMCDDENCAPINFSDFVAFAEEANGSLSMYNPSNGNVLLFSHDQNFDYVEFMEEQPHYTFHTFKGIVTFVNYVEEVANQWLNAIK